MTSTYPDAARMELRTHVTLAADAIPHFWPFRTFIHHNPLHGFEAFSFEQAVRHGQQLFKGRGYLPNEVYRRYYDEGRIASEHLEAVLEQVAIDQHVLLGDHRVSHRDVRRTMLLHGGDTHRDSGSHPPSNGSASSQTSTLAEHLQSFDLELDPATQTDATTWDSVELPFRETLATWCDRTLGSQINEQINNEMIKWCQAFLDEGQATWPMPLREHTFYRAWKGLAREDWSLALLGIEDGPAKIAALSDRPEDAVLESLARLNISKDAWQAYFVLHLVALPGWAGFIRWRTDHPEDEWQREYPVDIVKYLAIRLFYERELVSNVCQRELGINGDFTAIRTYIEEHPHAVAMRQDHISGRVPQPFRQAVDRLLNAGGRDNPGEWERLRADYEMQQNQDPTRYAPTAETLIELLASLDLDPTILLHTSSSDLHTLLDWIDGFPESDHGPLWLEAFEATYRDTLLTQLLPEARNTRATRPPEQANAARPPVQAVFCMDVRSEVIRRHLERLSGYETFGVPGFFGLPISYQPYGMKHCTAQCPVLLKPQHVIREIPRPYRGKEAIQHQMGRQLAHTGHALLHDLKENVITPYVMVEALGWFFSLPFFGKSVSPRWYHGWTSWLRRKLIPLVATTLPVEKLTRDEAEEIIATEQRAIIRRALSERLAIRGLKVSPEVVEVLRIHALSDTDDDALEYPDAAAKLEISKEKYFEFVRVLQTDYDLTLHGTDLRLERITHTGFTAEEKVYYVEAALRMLGLTDGFARFVLICGHRSTSNNNPYESALDCGACGGNGGTSNARAFVAMANRPHVREMLAKRGIDIPSDTYFLAALHDTTTDDVHIFDIEDVPVTHGMDLSQLVRALDEASQLVREERLPRFPEESAGSSSIRTQLDTLRRSYDWSQVRPEWGLSRNSALIIGRRHLTRALNLEGRCFLVSYNPNSDADGRILEVVLTAPMVVAQWINMEHYFSTVDNEVYGSGSKIYHNVVGFIGVMSGAQSDLRIGLPQQTVMDGPHAYHDPLRLLVVVEAQPERLSMLIQRNGILQHLFDNRWVNLVALDPHEAELYQYVPSNKWIPVKGAHRE